MNHLEFSDIAKVDTPNGTRYQVAVSGRFDCKRIDRQPLYLLCRFFGALRRD